MHCITLADLAATLAQQGPLLLRHRAAFPHEVLMRYWTASRTRNDLWHRGLARYREAKRSDDYPALHRWWAEHLAMLEEVLVSELLTRVVAAIAAESIRGEGDDAEESSSFFAIAHGVYLSQLEASNRVAQVLLEAAGARVQDKVHLNRLRYGVQRWTDWLIGRVNLDLQRGLEYCLEPARAESFSRELRDSGTRAHRDMTTWLMNAAMREMLLRRTSPEPALPQANRQVAAAALALFRPDLFDDLGVPKSLWMHRLQEASDSSLFGAAGTGASGG